MVNMNYVAWQPYNVISKVSVDSDSCYHVILSELHRFQRGNT